MERELQPAYEGSFSRVSDVCATVEDRRPTPNYVKLHTAVAKLLNGKFKVHAETCWLSLAPAPRFAPTGAFAVPARQD